MVLKWSTRTSQQREQFRLSAAEIGKYGNTLAAVCHENLTGRHYSLMLILCRCNIRQMFYRHQRQSTKEHEIRWQSRLWAENRHRSMMIFATYASMNLVTRRSLTAAPGMLPICHTQTMISSIQLCFDTVGWATGRASDL